MPSTLPTLVGKLICNERLSLCNCCLAIPDNVASKQMHNNKVKGKTMTKKAHNQAVNLIRSMFVRMERIFESSTDWNRYIDMIKDEERQHRNFGKGLGQDWLSRADSVRLFAVRNILWSFKPKPEDFFHVKPSCFGGFALKVERMGDLVEDFTKEEREAFLALDYAQLNQEPSF